MELDDSKPQPALEFRNFKLTDQIKCSRSNAVFRQYTTTRYTQVHGDIITACNAHI